MVEMNKEQEKKAREQFLNDIKDVDENDVEYASRKGFSKMEKLGSAPTALAKLWEDIKTMISLLSDYVTKKYTDVPWKVIAAIAGAIVYFVSPIDVIPDFIPVVGYLDDAMVIKLALDLAGSDLDKYREWKIKQN